MQQTSSANVVVRVAISGQVQGVGFRPFVYVLATELNLRGSVRNAGGFVIIEAAGNKQDIDAFVRRLKADAPPLACIAQIEVTHMTQELPPGSDASVFVIEESTYDDLASPMIPADTATCQDCLNEFHDSCDRRHLYPFINCTNCGPRFTVIKSLPYDRKQTTMSCFDMCKQCQAEYQNPTDRRFHAQPIGCWDCGPKLHFVSAMTTSNEFVSANVCAQQAAITAIDLTIAELKAGKIIALKGLGGYQLACRALDETAVVRLRDKKKRYGKPFAVMFRDIEQLMDYCHVNEFEKRVLCGICKPIVLLAPTPKGTCQLPDVVSNHAGCIGAMLPYTPLHLRLLEQFDEPLVLTSGNVSEEPIATGNREALSRLGTIADGFLLHNRDISTRFDDSVVRLVGSEPALIRRSRGYAPQSVPLSVSSNFSVLAFGGQLKNTFCLTQGNNAYISQHVGDMHTLETVEFFKETLEKFQMLFNIDPQLIAFDLHPDYMSTRLAQELAATRNLPSVGVQHHHAHIASCMAEHGLDEPVIGVAFDGSGYGDDGTVWGGEFLVTQHASYERFAHFAPVPMPGSSAAVRNPWRMAVSYLSQPAIANETECTDILSSIIDRVGIHAVTVSRQQSVTGTNAPLTSSCGRLFDAVASILGLCDAATFEAQAAMLLESMAARADYQDRRMEQWDPAQGWHRSSQDVLQIETAPLIHHVCAWMQANWSKEHIAYAFHCALSEIVTAVCCEARRRHNIAKVCLSGGVFQNVVLTQLCSKSLADKGFSVFTQKRVPANDGGLSFGQAAVAIARHKLQQAGL